MRSEVGMCCFSRPVKRVENTRIFARSVGPGRQALAYAMDFAAAGSLAMVLPIPTPARSADDAVAFVDLSSSPDLFDRLARAFPAYLGDVEPMRKSAGLANLAPKLTVHRVGAFEASFVPRREDFTRLDARFRLDPSVWDALPGVADWGFVVVKLAGQSIWRRLSGKVDAVHPIAFTFPSRSPERLFFPTLHVHDGRVRPAARFDHELYAQAAAAPAEWEASLGPLGPFFGEHPPAIVDPGSGGWKLALQGELPNRDTWLDQAPSGSGFET